MENNAKEWIPFRKLVREDTYFNPCPICGGQVMQGRDLMFPLPSNPQCQKCGRSFEMQKKFYFLKGFKIVKASKFFRPKVQNT